MSPEENLGLREQLLLRFQNDPDGDAFVFHNDEHALTNREVLEFALGIGAHLVRTGFGSGEILGLLHDQSRTAYLAQLALFLRGIPYVIFDQEAPPERINRASERLGLRFILVFPRTHISEDLSIATLCLDLEIIESEMGGTVDCLPAVSPDHLAYVVLTSGSTGEPKAVGITHANLRHFSDWAVDTFSLGRDDVFLSLNPPHFDNAVFDFYCSLASGGSLVVIPSRLVLDADALPRVIMGSRCNVWFSVPSLILYLMKTQVLNQQTLSGFRKILFGGEGFPVVNLQRLWNLTHGRDTRLWNVYGPSECACMCSAHEIRSSDLEGRFDLPPIGVMGKNFDYRLVDLDNRGVGELLLLGPQVGVGYLGDARATERAFPEYNEGPGGSVVRGYLTGDLMRVDSEGLLRFAGRKDTQVKVMGRRVDLAEIEAEVLRVDGCFEAHVAVARGASGLPIISAWVGTDRTVGEIRAALARVLPSYLIPKTIETLRELPKNRNGKIDRHALTAGLR